LCNVIKANATKLISAWLEGPPKKQDLSDSAFMGVKGPRQALHPVQHGRPLQCCSEKDIMKVKGSSLYDEIFEMLIFMRGNKHHLRGINDSSYLQFLKCFFHFLFAIPKIIVF
jgi:hypothetical protein